MLSIGRLCGLILVTLTLLQLLTMSRAPWLEQAFGLDKLARIHHKIGRYFIIFLILHPLLVIISYSSFAKIGLVAQYFSLLKSEDVPNASIAFALFLGIIIYSLLRVWKNWNFEKWYYVHLVMYAAVLLAFGHQTSLGGDFLGSTFFTYYWYVAYAFVGVNLAYFRFLLPVLNFGTYKFTVSQVAQETSDVQSVYITGRNLEKLTVRAGQFFIVRFLVKPFVWEAHPFSMSKHPDGKSLRLTIKGVGDFSKSIHKLKPGTKVLMEGPYGVFTAGRSKTNKILLVAGGIGITPYRGIMEDLGKAGKNIELVYGNKTETDIALRAELEGLAEKYHIKIHHVLSNAETLPKVTTYNPQTTSFSKGFVTPEAILQLVPDMQEREFFLCGPPPMLNALLKSLPPAGVNKQWIYYEKFAL
jgi:predicted ferric reductase